MEARTTSNTITQYKDEVKADAASVSPEVEVKTTVFLPQSLWIRAKRAIALYPGMTLKQACIEGLDLRVAQLEASPISEPPAKVSAVPGGIDFPATKESSHAK